MDANEYIKKQWPERTLDEIRVSLKEKFDLDISKDAIGKRAMRMRLPPKKSVNISKATREYKNLPHKAQRHLSFARTWNSKQIRVRHELQQATREKEGPLPSWEEVWKLRGKYSRYRRSHPELHDALPQLIVRQYDTGEPKELHPFVEAHLDEYKADRKRLKKAKGLVIGCYQWGAIPAPVIETAKVYAAYHGFEFIAGLSQYGRIEMDRDTDELISVLPENLKGHIVVDSVSFGDFKIDCNTHLTQTSDTYLTDPVCEIANEQSTIFLGTKQEMRHWMRLEKEYPACYMTTGSLSYPNHKRTRLGRNNKAVAVAKHRHEYGFIVLELVKDTQHGTFAIPRQLRSTPEGHLYDIDVKHGGARLFTPEGHLHRPEGVDTLKCGDLHEAGLDPEIWDITFEGKGNVAGVLKPKHVHLGDTLDNLGANPYNDKQALRTSYLTQHGLTNLRSEMDACVARLKRLHDVLPEGAIITHEPSNHPDDWLRAWLNKGDPRKDPLNAPFFHELWLMVYEQLQREGRLVSDKNVVEEKSPFGLYIKSKLPYVECPSYQELEQIMRPAPGPLVLRRIFMHHGHIGPRGKETLSIRTFAPFNKSSAGGHVHTATRHNAHDQVGVMTKRRKHYVQGPKTNWTNSHLAIFENGETAHVFIIYRRWHGDHVVPCQPKKKRKH